MPASAAFCQPSETYLAAFDVRLRQVWDDEAQDRLQQGRHQQLVTVDHHADQRDLINFVTGIPTPPAEVRLVHGDEGAKTVLAGKLREVVKGAEFCCALRLCLPR